MTGQMEEDDIPLLAMGARLPWYQWYFLFGMKIGVVRRSLLFLSFNLASTLPIRKDFNNCCLIVDVNSRPSTTLSKIRDQKGQFGGSDHGPRLIQTGKYLEALTGKMSIRVRVFQGCQRPTQFQYN